MSDEQPRPARPWTKVAVGLVLGLLVGVALWLTVPRGPVLNAVGLEGSDSGCEEAVSTYEREMDEYGRQGREYKRLVPDSPEERGLEWKSRSAQEFRQHHQRVEQVRFQTFNSIERAALVAQQNPDCFSPEQRAEVEQHYRFWQRQMEQRGD